MRRLLLASTLAFLSMACGSESDPGEACDRPGGTADVCGSDTVCGKPSDSSNVLVCIYICGDDKDCPSGADCKGVDGTSIKGCRSKS